LLPASFVDATGQGNLCALSPVTGRTWDWVSRSGRLIDDWSGPVDCYTDERRRRGRFVTRMVVEVAAAAVAVGVVVCRGRAVCSRKMSGESQREGLRGLGDPGEIEKG
jgi:hypothetical protein